VASTATSVVTVPAASTGQRIPYFYLLSTDAAVFHYI